VECDAHNELLVPWFASQDYHGEWKSVCGSQQNSQCEQSIWCCSPFPS